MKIEIILPAWFSQWQSELPDRVEGDGAAMALTIETCRRNLDAGTGGPFGALVVDNTTHEILSTGVNLVVEGRASILHAEIVALTLAQQRIGHNSLSVNERSTTLYTTAEPCAMCMGAIPWSGVSRVVCGARDEDVRAIGFDEGDKPLEWVAKLEHRGIAVTRDVMRSEAIQLLERYSAEGGIRYG